MVLLFTIFYISKIILQRDWIQRIIETLTLFSMSVVYITLHFLFKKVHSFRLLVTNTRTTLPVENIINAQISFNIRRSVMVTCFFRIFAIYIILMDIFY